MRGGILKALLLLSLLTFMGCATVQGPEVTDQEIEEARAQLQKKAELFKKEQEERINRVGQRLLAALEEPHEVKFQMVEDESVNAGAGLKDIAVTTGMVRFLKSDDELSVVLGHELAHITQGHIKKALITQLPIIIGSALAEAAAGGSVTGISNIGQLFAQRFSRDFEKEADYFGLIYSYRAGYDPKAGVRIWERFAVELPSSMNQSLFASHPSSPERMLKAEKIADQLVKGEPLEE